jgi:ATPase subunit of ABC transporter with duplicated ATPase domains
MTETQKQRESQLARLFTLEQERKKAQAAVQFEQKRAASSKNAGKDENDRKLKGAMKEKGSKTEGKKKGQINAIKSQIETTLQNFRLPEVIRPKFSISAENVGSKTLVSITNGEIGYDELILKNINFSCFSGQRIALKGKNGSGKSTLLKAILGSSEVKKTGEWYVLSPSDIGFLDQHYRSLDLSKTVIENLENQMPHWTRIELRKHLNDFLFRSNEEVSNLGKNLSGGERARLSLALIAAKTPKLLILDEITNNLDLETRNHVIDILKNYPGAMMIVSHDDDFLKAIGVDEEIDLSSMAIS